MAADVEMEVSPRPEWSSHSLAAHVTRPPGA
jgi:hypothetical protein